MTGDDVVVATPPTSDNDEGRLDRSAAEEFVARAGADGVDLVGSGGLLGDLTKQILEAGLEVEMDEHLGYSKHDSAGRDGGNSRNGTRSETLITEVGPVDVEVPRDRDSSFEPVTVKKRQRRLNGVDSMVISLTAKALTTGEVHAHLAETYGTDVSRETISKITDRVLEELADWQNRPLDGCIRWCSSTRSWSRSATAKSPTGPSTPRSESLLTANVRSSACGSAPAARAPSIGYRC